VPRSYYRVKPELWKRFCDELADAGRVIRRDASPRDPLDVAEGYRYLSRLTRLALEKFVEHADPEHPRFYRLSHETGKIGADNPDSYYQNAAIDGHHDYIVRGDRGTVAYLGLGTYYGDYNREGPSGCSGYLEAGDIEVADDGTMEVWLSAEERPGNWLPMREGTAMLIVRQNFLDRSSERPARLTIERVEGPEAPRPLEATSLAAGLERAASYVTGTAELFARWAEGFVERSNELIAMDPAVTGGAHGDPNMFFYMGYWQLAADECLVVEAMPPECQYWNFQLNNHWMESLDYRCHSIHYNKHTTTYRTDGSFRLVVAHQDPGLPNWVDTAGHRRGTMALRWAKASDHPQPTVRVVKRTTVGQAE